MYFSCHLRLMGRMSSSIWWCWLRRAWDPGVSSSRKASNYSLILFRKRRMYPLRFEPFIFISMHVSTTWSIPVQQSSWIKKREFLNHFCPGIRKMKKCFGMTLIRTLDLELYLITPMRYDTLDRLTTTVRFWKKTFTQKISHFLLNQTRSVEEHSYKA